MSRPDLEKGAALPTDDLPPGLPEDPQQPINVLSLPYVERQAVFVLNDRDTARARAALLDLTRNDRRSVAAQLIRRDDQSPEWMGIALARLEASGQLPPIAAHALRLVPVAYRVFKDWRETQIGALTISASEAAQLRWPKGDPARGTLYVGSPADPPTYYPAASFHDDVLTERYDNLVQLLSRLGARRLTTRVVQGRGLDGDLTAEVPTPSGANVGAAAGRGRSIRSAKENSSEMEPMEPVPRDQLAIGLPWYPRERTWQRLAELRYKGQAKREHILLKQDSDHGLNARFEAAISGGSPLKSHIGGTYKRYEETTWEIDVEF